MNMARRKINVVLSLSASRGMLLKTARRRRKSRRKARRRHRRHRKSKK
jgi:hypothetical protein